MKTHERVTFDFNRRGRKGLSGIIYGKGGLFTVTGLIVFLIGAIGVVAMPWRANPSEIAFKAFIFLILLILPALQFYRAIIRLSINDQHIFVKIWKKEKAYPIKYVRKIKTTYYPSWGIASVKLVCKGKLGLFIVWAPRFDTERHSLYLAMSSHLEKTIQRNGDC